MSSYISRWCDKHGDWEQDVDHPGEECPDCVEVGESPSQIAYRLSKERDSRIAALEAECNQLRLLVVKACEYLREVGNDYPGSFHHKWCHEKADECMEGIK